MARPNGQTAPDTPRRLDASVRATRKAAWQARRALRRLALPRPLGDHAELLVSELVTNSVRHAELSPDDLIQITADWSGTRLKVAVRAGRGVLPTPVSGPSGQPQGRSRAGGCSWSTGWPAAGGPPPLALAACEGASTNEPPASTTTAAPAATAAPTTRAPATTIGPATTISERLAHWREVVAPMRCAELADLEQKRLAVQFNDQAESLIATHERQAKLNCPQ